MTQGGPPNCGDARDLRGGTASLPTEKNRPFRCRVCSVEVEWSGRGRHPRLCSRHKKSRAAYPSRNSWVSPTLCTVEGCDRPHQARGLCKPHWKQARRAEGYRAPSDSWDETKRDKYHRRRAGGARNGDVVLLEQVVARDGVDCRWCGLPVDFTKAFPHPWSRSLDHIVPLARGGRHELANVQLMHFSCNSSKGAR